MQQQPHNTNDFYANQYNIPPQQYHQGNQNGNLSMSHQTPQSAGTMGPPTKPAERDNANDDQTDVLANAGVDLRAEENFALSFYTGSFGSQPTFSQGIQGKGHAFTQFVPRDGSTFYGAGPANQPGESSEHGSQESFIKAQVDTAWADAASSLARSREHELQNPHVEVAVLWRKMDKIARENGIILNTDNGKMPSLKLPSDFRSEVQYRSAIGPSASLTATGGPFLPQDTALADQLALMSLATNTRLRILLEDAYAITRSRRTGADGVVPTEWAGVAVPGQGSSNTVVHDGAARPSWQGVNGHTAIGQKSMSYSDIMKLY